MFLYYLYAGLNFGLILLFPRLWFPLLIGGMCLLFLLSMLLTRTIRQNAEKR
jgi:hypothetical protein